MDSVPFKTEAELCEAFIELYKEEWQAYRETEDFDILMVRKSDGFQVGVEAKLKLNVKVILQVAEPILKYYAASPGPDCRAVLVPSGCGNADLTDILKYLHITPLWVTNFKYGERTQLHCLPGLPRNNEWDDGAFYELAPAERCPLPDYIPDVRAGISGPTKLTAWKVKAIKLAISLEREGYVTRQHFKHFDISPTMWTQRGWILRNESVKGYVANGELMPDFRKQHPINFAEIEVTYDKWRLK